MKKVEFSNGSALYYTHLYQDESYPRNIWKMDYELKSAEDEEIIKQLKKKKKDSNYVYSGTIGLMVLISAVVIAWILPYVLDRGTPLESTIILAIGIPISLILFRNEYRYSKDLMDDIEEEQSHFNKKTISGSKGSFLPVLNYMINIDKHRGKIKRNDKRNFVDSVYFPEMLEAFGVFLWNFIQYAEHRKDYDEGKKTLSDIEEGYLHDEVKARVEQLNLQSEEAHKTFMDSKTLFLSSLEDVKEDVKHQLKKNELDKQKQQALTFLEKTDGK